jgi:hypothetical protein
MAVPIAGFLSLVVKGVYLGFNPCSETTCSHRSITRVELIYRFPPWLLDRLLHLLVINVPGSGPAASLSVTRVVADDADIMNLVKAGNLEDVKFLFARGLASPNDVNASCEVPILNVSKDSYQHS